MHLARLKVLLDQEGIDYQFYVSKANRPDHAARTIGESRFNHLPIALAAFRNGVIHAHLTKPEGIHWLARFSYLRIPVLLSLHSMGVADALSNSDEAKNSLLFSDLLSFQAIICMNSETKRRLLEVGIPANLLHHVPAFLPPPPIHDLVEKLPEYIITALLNGNPIISLNAFSFDEYNGSLLYGIDMAMDLCSNLKTEFPNLRMIFIQSVSKGIVDDLWVKREIAKREISEQFIFHLGNCDFTPILASSSLFIRPTNTDGDALSIRESLYYGVPTIASDCVTRPEGTILFKTRDTEALIETCRETLRELDNRRFDIANIRSQDFGKQLIEIILSFIK